MSLLKSPKPAELICAATRRAVQLRRTIALLLVNGLRKVAKMAKQRASIEKAFEMLTGSSLAKGKSSPQSAYLRRTYYITEKQYKAMRLKAAMSEMPDDKDLSAIVRSALDAYLADELKKL
jgi:hypothetical protein